MKTFLIDPDHRTITAIDFVAHHRAVLEIIGCRSVTGGSLPLNGSLEKGFDAVYVSDDMLEDRDDPQHWFQVDADHNPPSSYPIAGRGLVIGVDTEGDSCDARIGLEELTARISFTRRKFRGFTVGDARGGIAITLNAPIIEER